jgi:hypothetical protein
VALNGGTVKIISCSAASANGFVVAAVFVSEQEVVHSSLTAGHKLERFENEIHYFLRSFHVSTNNCCLFGGRENGALWYDDGKGPQTA